jgi:4-amino-4-deoxy-L-arabinose transferase-like glycosyltransferase
MKPRFQLLLPLIALFGLALRLAYVLIVQKHAPVGGDGLEFHILANQLADGDGYVQPLIVSPGHVATADKPPLYPLLLALPSLVGWDSLVAHRVMASVMGAVLVVAVGLLGRRVGGERVGLVAAALTAVYPVLITLDGSLRSESLYAPLIAFTLLAAYRLADRPGFGRAAVLGMCVGLAALTRSEALLLGGLLLVLVALRLPRPGGLKYMATMSVVALLVLTPWVARNWAEFGQPLLSTNSGSLAYGANCHAAYYSRLIGTWPCFPRLAVAPGRDEADVSADLRHTGLTYAHDHASRLPAVAAVRVLRTFDFWSPSFSTRFEADIGNRDVNVYRVGVGMYYVLVALAVAGAVMLRRRGERVGILLAPFVVVVAVSILAYGTPRFRVPAEVPLLVLAAVALVGIAARLEERGAAGRADVTAEALA